jgi:hypothetical protein
VSQEEEVEGKKRELEELKDEEKTLLEEIKKTEKELIKLEQNLNLAQELRREVFLVEICVSEMYVYFRTGLIKILFCVHLKYISFWPLAYIKPRNTKGGSITVPLTSCFTGLD